MRDARIRLAIPTHLSASLFAGRQRAGALVRFGGETMGTDWSVLAIDPPDQSLPAIETVFARIIDQMSNWEAASSISRFNAAPVGEWVPLPHDLLLVLCAGLDMAQLSGGAFDPAIGHIVGRWGFGPQAGSGDEHGPCWQAIEVDGDRARRHAHVALDLSGIAKGFAIDAVTQALLDCGVANFLVEVGGELRGAGVKPDLQPWWIDAETPPGLSVPTLRVALSGLAVATSGDYRRFRMEAGRRLSHSIDPVRRMPMPEDVAAVTVLHDSAMWADAWATAITVMGMERGMALATRHGIAARLIRRIGKAGQDYLTPALAAMLAE